MSRWGKDQVVTNSRYLHIYVPGELWCFLDKVRRHIGVRRLRHFVNRNLTLVKYTGMLVAKKGPFC